VIYFKSVSIVNNPSRVKDKFLLPPIFAAPVIGWLIKEEINGENRFNISEVLIP